MKRIALIALLITTTLLAVLFTTVFLVTKLDSVHQYLLSRVNSSLPGTFTLERLNFSILKLRLEINDFSLADSSGTPLAGFKRVLVDVSTLALLHKKVIIKEALLEHPWVHLETDSTGRLLLLDAFSPQKPATPDTATVNPVRAPFALELQNLRIIGGTVRFAAAQDSLLVHAKGLTIAAQGAWDTLSLKAKLAFSLDSASLERTGSTQHVYDLAFLAQITGEQIDTVSLKLRTNKSAISLYGRGSPLADTPLVDITVAADVALSELSDALGIHNVLSGASQLRLHLFGDMADPEGAITITCKNGMFGGYPVDTFSLQTNIRQRVLSLQPLFAKTADGTVTLTGSIDASTMFPSGYLAAPSSVNLLKYALSLTGTNIPLDRNAPGRFGTATASLLVQGQGVLPDSLSATVHAKVGVAALQIDSSSLPLDVSIVCLAGMNNGYATLDSLTGTIGSTTIALSGGYDISSGAISASVTTNIPSLDTLLTLAGVDSIYGNATVTAQVKGDIHHPEAVLDVTADSIKVGAVRIGSIALAGALDGSGKATVTSLSLVNGHSQLTLSGSAKLLDNGRLLPTDQILFDGSLASAGVSLPDFIDSLEGIVFIDATIAGTMNKLDGQIRLRAKDLLFSGQRIAQANLVAQFDGERVTILPLTIAPRPNQELTITGWASLKDSFNIALSAPQIHLNSIAALAAVDSLDGVVSIAMRAGGTYTNPEADGTIAVDNIAFKKLTIDPVTLKLKLHDKLVEVAGSALGALTASYNLATQAFSTNLTLQDLELTPYLALSGKKLDGRITATIAASGTTDSLAAIAGTFDIKRLVVGYNNVPLVETHHLFAALENGTYSLPVFSISLAGEGAIKGHAKGLIAGPHDVAVTGMIPLTIVRHFAPDLGDIDGAVSIDAFFKGTPEKSDMKAEVALKDVGMIIPGLSQRLHHINGRILANPKAIRIENIRGKLDDGTFDVKGRVRLDKFAFSSLRADVTLEAVPVEVPDMLDMLLDAKLHIAGSPDTTQVSGDIVVVDGLYYKDIVVDLNPLTAMGQRKRKEAATPVESTIPYLKNMQFDVGVQARSPIRADNNMAQLTIAPDLHLMGSLQTPALSGRADVEQGTITYLKKVFTVERGVIDFVNPYAIEPHIDIKGNIPVGQRDDTVTITLTGTPDALDFKLSSNNTKLEDQDILSLLVLGKTTSEFQSDIQSGSIVESNPQQLLASLVASTFGEDIKKATGLDMLEVETGSADRDTSDRISVTIGKQITRNIGTRYTIESEDITVVQRATVEYRIMQNLYLTGFQDTKPAYGGELRFTWERR